VSSRGQTDEYYNISRLPIYTLHYSRSTEKYKLSSKNEENERTISVTKKGHCACLHHSPINIPTSSNAFDLLGNITQQLKCVQPAGQSYLVTQTHLTSEVILPCTSNMFNFWSNLTQHLKHIQPAIMMYSNLVHYIDHSVFLCTFPLSTQSIPC
jgi:hypothetical protein